MEELTVNPRGAKVTDEELRECLRAGMKPADIARRYDVSKAAVSKRLAKLQGVTCARAVMQPAEGQRFARTQIDALEQLSKGLGRVNLLMDACHDWLTDANDPERYDVGPRHHEVEITYEVEIETVGAKGEVRYRTEKRKKKLTELMATLEGYDEDGARYCGWKKGETKHSDPRELILSTAREARQTVETAADLARMLADQKAMTVLREAIIREIRACDPAMAERIAEAVQRSILLDQALSGLGALAAGTGPFGAHE